MVYTINMKIKKLTIINSLIMIVASILALTNCVNTQPVIAKPPMYAQIKNSNTYLYKR